MTESCKKTILIVDDEPVNIMVLSNILKDQYRVIAARNGEQALARMEGETRPELVLLDVMMPEIDGYTVCKRLKQNPETSSIPVIFVTAMSDEIDEKKGLELGAVDYITKPVSPSVVRIRVKNHLTLKEAQETLEKYNQTLEKRVEERTQELIKTQDVTIHALASLAETRDNETGNHLRRTQYYVEALAKELVASGKYVDQLNDETITLLFKSAPLHDIGKVGIPDSILLKPGKLTDEEFEIMKNHATLGADAIEISKDSLENSETSFLRFAREIAGTHHEKWNGSGYPIGLVGVDIPLSGRLMAVADVYDALISKRVYKPAFSHAKSRDIIIEGRGSHFDPDIVDAFIRIEEKFRQIAALYKDND